MTNLAQTSHYEVQFGTLPPQLMSYLSTKGINSRFIAESAGLLCYSAVLPTSTLGSFTIDGNYMGIQEKFASSRIYSEITLDFYVDSDYQMLNFLECWMEFVSSGSYNNQILPGENAPISQNSDAYFVRMQYPAYYKADAVRIFKFDRDYRREIEYNFRGLFPLNISSIPVSYATSDAMKVSVSFQYDRYIAGKTNSFNRFVSRNSNNLDPLQYQYITNTTTNTTTRNNNNNLNSTQSRYAPNNPLSAEEIYRQTENNFQSVSESLASNPPIEIRTRII